MSSISLTALRSQLFKIVDRVIETGMPAEIERKGHKLKIVLEEKKSKFDNLKRRNCIVGDPDELIDLEERSVKACRRFKIRNLRTGGIQHTLWKHSKFRCREFMLQ